MYIRNKNNYVAGIEGNATSFEVDLNKSIKILFKDEMEFSKPGEYEFKGVDITSREILVDEGYSESSNASKVVVDGVRVLFLLNSLEAKQDDLNQILDIDVLVLKDTDLTKIDRLAMLYNPEKVVVLAVQSKESEIEEIIKKSFSTSAISTEKQLKTKSDEYGSENFIVSFTILKK